MNTCDTCKHWRRVERPFDVEHHGKHAGECNSDAFEYKDAGGEVPHKGLAYWDYEGYSAGFMTAEDFGCVNWKAR